MIHRQSLWSWLCLAFILLYFFVPLYATFQFSLQAKRGQLGFTAYQNIFSAPDFSNSFLFSFQTALLTIAISMVLIIPTAYWVNLKLTWLRPIVEFLTLIPFVIPAVIVAFGLIRAYNRTLLTDSGEGVYVLLVGAYVSLSFPYMYRAVDTGLQAINVRTLTEAAQSLGASWIAILVRVIFPNIFRAVLTGAFITFAIAMGEFTIASLLSQPAFGPYMAATAARKVYEPSALAIVSFGLTWLCIAGVQILTRRNRGGRVPTALIR